MKLISIGKRVYTVPETWNELTGGQLIEVMGLLNTGEMTLLQAQVRLFRILTGMSKYRMWRVGAVSIEELLYLTDFLLADNSLTKNVIPTYRGLIGPADDFRNLVAGEYTYAEHFYGEFHAAGQNDQPSIGSLNMLVATLYRPAKKKYDHTLNPDGDGREPFNEHVTALYAKAVSTWPTPVKMAILHWYEGCRISLRNKHPEPFMGGGEPGKYGMFTVMRGVAEKGIHGPLKEVERMYVNTFLMEITEIMEEAKRISRGKTT